MFYLRLFFLFFLSIKFSAASGIKTHLWVGESIIDEITVDCLVEIKGRQYSIQKKFCEGIKQNRKDFLAGVLGPDVFPDILVGQSFLHPGVEGGWKADDWMMHVLSNAKSNRQVAFAAGNLVHASTGINAHTYVNMYSGGVWAFDDELTVERRHFVLEKYIDNLLPQYSFKGNDIAVQSEWLRDVYIFNDAAQSQYEKKPTASHLVAMHQVRKSVKTLHQKIKKLEDGLNNILAESLSELINIQAVTTRKLIELVDEQKLHLEIVNAMDDLHEEIDKAYDDLDNLLSESLKHSDAYLNAHSRLRLEHKLEDILKEANKLGVKSEDIYAEYKRLLNVLNSTPEYKEIKKLCPLHSGLVATCNEQVLNEAFKIASDALSRQLSIAGRNNAELKGAISLFNSAIEQIEKELNPLKRLFDLTQRSIDAKKILLKGLQLQLETKKRTAEEIKSNIKRLNEEYSKLQKMVVDKETARDHLKNVLSNFQTVSALTSNWIKGIDNAGKEYINTSTMVAKSLINGRRDYIEHYQKWLACYGTAFMSIPYQIPDFSCEVQDELLKARKEIEGKLEELFLFELLPLYKITKESINDLEELFRNEIQKLIEKASLELVEALTNKITSDFMAIISGVETVDENKLNAVFSTDDGRKKLLVYGKVSDLINKDLGVNQGEMNTDRYHALDYSVRWSKLSLLKPESIDELIKEHLLTEIKRRRKDKAEPLVKQDDLVESDIVSKNYFSKHYEKDDYSLLFRMVKNLDGNHQWAPYGVPFAVKLGNVPNFTPVNPLERQYGYGRKDEASPLGFVLFQNEILRKYVFLKLFPYQIEGQLSKRVEYKRHPFRSCETHPFPITFDRAGEYVKEDDSCP